MLIMEIVASGLWAPVHNEEWDGDAPLNNTHVTLEGPQTGTVIFQGLTLPWIIGQYEVSLSLGHHGSQMINIHMHMNVPINLGQASPQQQVQCPQDWWSFGDSRWVLTADNYCLCVELNDDNHEVNKLTSLDFTSIRKCLTDIVLLCLDNDPYLIPLSCGGTHEPSMDGDRSSAFSDVQDLDDFSFWSECQAKCICAAIEQAFDVEYTPEVIVADANLMRLAHRILASKKLLVL